MEIIVQDGNIMSYLKNYSLIFQKIVDLQSEKAMEQCHAGLNFSKKGTRLAAESFNKLKYVPTSPPPYFQTFARPYNLRPT